MLGPLSILAAGALFLAGYQTYVNRDYETSRGALFWWAWSALVLFSCGLAAAIEQKWISFASIAICFIADLGWIYWRIEDRSEYDETYR